MTDNINYKSIFNKYDNYYEKKLSSPLINHSQIQQIINEIRNKNLFNVELVGKSVEGKEIYSISFGSGNTKILAWSQMHGDEPTATAALFELINFFSLDDEYKSFKKYILQNLNIHIIPMLNPDGAEKFQRENAFNIDINRDALRLQANESKILWELANKLKPQFCFNLHDQNSYYTVGRSSNTAAISLLAPPNDFEKSISETREKSMQVIVRIKEVLNEFIPNNIARYDDDFEPRAFGDNFTKNGISSILIESGFLKNDVDKLKIRKLNFIALLAAFDSIAKKDYSSKDIQKYFDIPENNTLLFDLLLRNLNIYYNDKSFVIDVGINREKKYDNNSCSFYYIGKIKEVGDLSIFYGIEEYDLSNYIVEPAKIYDGKNHGLDNLLLQTLYKDGYGYIKSNFHHYKKEYLFSPINLLYNEQYIPKIAAEEYANLLIRKENHIDYVVINGFFQTLNDSKIRILNGIVIH